MRTNERGIALIMVLLIMMLMSALMVGFTAVVMSDQRFRGIDRDRMQAFYAAHSGLEKMTADLRALFGVSVAPSVAQLAVIQAAPPVIPGITYQAADGSSGYTLTGKAPVPGIIPAGPSSWAGLSAVKTTYELESTARTAVGGEVHLSRRLETVAIPVFQFGMFSDVDLSYFAGPDFSFGGRVHTNGNLFLAQGDGGTLTLTDRVTAFKEIVRQNLSNGVSIGGAHRGTVIMRTAGAPRILARTEGSVDDVGALNPNWTNISDNIYGTWISNYTTKATELKLPILNTVLPPVTNIELVKRPTAAEAATSALFAERYFSKVSLRILLSDTAAEITNLPGIDTTKPPMRLDGIWTATTPAGYGALTPTHPPIALSPGPTILAAAVATTGNTSAGSATINVGSAPSPLTFPMLLYFGNISITCTGFTGASSKLTGCVGTPDMSNGTQLVPTTGVNSNALFSKDTGLIGGYIKIERQNNAKIWNDVTLQILNYGIAGPNATTNCASTAIIVLQRLRDDLPGCAGSSLAYDYWPNTLFDVREGLQRDNDPATPNVKLGGVMHYVTIDARNLMRWFQGTAVPYNGGTGATANNDGGAGFSVYFSDRRNNRNGATPSVETGEYGFEDVVNPASGTGAPNGVLDVGEDVNVDAVVNIYGEFPSYDGNATPPVPGPTGPLTIAARPWDLVSTEVAKANRAIFFRRALKLVNGRDLTGGGIRGLTIATENPIYVQGDWNANAAAGGFADPHIATSLIADAVTLLSNDWNDNKGYTSPYDTAGRNRIAPSFYRAAIIAGKGRSFPQPGGTANDFGTDGGAHNFLRFLEAGDPAVNYRGSLVTFYYSRQATGTFKCCTTVYGAPTRNYAFDTDFQNTALLPPLTPLLRDVNVLGFSQELRPGR